MRQVWSIIAGLFVLWAAFVLFATSTRGPGLSPDSMSYLAAAESIARGVGPEVPVADWSERVEHTRLRHFPPLFPALLALPVRLGSSPAQAARWLEALAAGTLSLLLAWIAVSCVGRTRARAGALVAGLGVMLAPAISLTFFMVLSEPLFLTLWTLTLLMMLRAPTASLALGCCAACCALTRYAGVSVVAAVAFWSLWQRGSWQLRVTRAVIAVAPAVVSLTVWRVWAGGELRRYAWYLDGFAANAHEAFATLRDALAPFPQTDALQPWHLLVSAAFVGLAVLLLMAAARHDRSPLVRFNMLWHAALLLTGTYLCMLLVSRLRADPEIPFDWRILSPVVLSCQLTLSVALVEHWHGLRARALRFSAGVLAVVWLSAASWNAAHNVRVMQSEGALYEGPEWQDSRLAHWLRSSGRQYALYSNNPPALWHLDHRSSRLLPKAADDTTRVVLLERMGERPSALLGFRDRFDTTTDPEQLAAQLGLTNRQCFEQACLWTTGPTVITETSQQAIVHAR